MPYRILALILWIVSVNSASGDISYAVAALNNEIPAPPDITTSSHSYLVYVAKPDTIQSLLAIVRQSQYQASWDQAFAAIGIIASVDPKSLQFRDLAAAVEQLETQHSTIPPSKFLPVLGSAYGAVGRFGGEGSFEFLRQRLEPSFWGKSMPTYSYEISGGSAKITVNALTEAIRGMSYHPSDQAAEYLRLLRTRKPFDSNPMLQQAVTQQLELRELEHEMLAERKNALAKREGSLTSAQMPESITSLANDQTATPSLAVESGSRSSASAGPAKPPSYSSPPATYKIVLVSGLVIALAGAGILFYKRKLF